MTSVAVSGVPGRLAQAIASAVVEAPDLELAAVFNPHRRGQEWEGIDYLDDPDDLVAEVVVEAGPTDSVFDNIRSWRARGVALVVGTSGFTADRLEELRSLWGDGGPGCLVVPNFSIGAVLSVRFAELAAPHFATVEVIERHSASKADAPSGTALQTATRLAAAGGRSASKRHELVAGALGGDVDGVHVHSLRLEGVLSHQEVAMTNPEEQFSIVHQSTGYGSFAGGALAAIRAVGDLEGVTVGLDAVLGL